LNKILTINRNILQIVSETNNNKTNILFLVINSIIGFDIVLWRTSNEDFEKLSDYTDVYISVLRIIMLNKEYEIKWDDNDSEKLSLSEFYDFITEVNYHKIGTPSIAFTNNQPEEGF